MAKDGNKAQKKNVKKLKDEKQHVNVVTKEKKVVEQEIVEKKNKKEKKNGSNTLVSAVKVVDDNRKAIIFGVVGFLLATLLFRCILWPDRIATLSDGTQPVATINGEAYTADKLYEEMKEYYSVNVLLNDIDDIILSELYPETEEMNTEVKNTAESYYSSYEAAYKYTKEQFLSSQGFKNEQEFIDVLKLNYRRNEYYNDYVEGLITEDEINKYYKDEVFGDVDSKHILVKIDEDSEDGLSKDEANKLAKEIIKKLDSGKTWDEVLEEYKDKIVSEELGYQAFNASLESSYLEECKELEVDKYSKTPVLTSYGYHIVYKIDQKETPKLEEVKDDIIEILATKMKKADTNLSNKALAAMREEAKLEFVDSVLADEYKEIVNSYK